MAETTKTFAGSVTLVRVSDGVDGRDGTNGNYVHVMYSAYSNGADMSSTPNTYMGVYNGGSEKPPSNPSLYQWTKIEGQDGESGKDGTTYYTWIKYADDNQGTNMMDDPEGRSYIGIAYNKTTQSESNNFADYSWSLIKGEPGKNGENGEPGKDGVDGINGQDGKTYYNWIRYADDAQGNGINSSPDGKFYIGIAYNKESSQPSDNPTDYTWSLFRGADGINGKDGEPGKDGKDGSSAPATKAQYSKDGEKDWTETLSPTEHKYVRFSYDDGKSWSDPIRFVGEDSSPFVIQSNYEEILRLVGLNNLNQEVVDFAPETIEFKVYDHRNNPPTPITLFDNQWALSILNSANNEWENIGEKIDNDFLYHSTISESDPEDASKGYQILYFNFKKYREKNSDGSNWLKGEKLPLFKFVYRDDSRVNPTKIIAVKNGLGSDTMHTLIGAGSLTATILKSSLKFSADGLELTNGDFTINSTDLVYEKVENEEDFTKARNQGILYILNDNGGYVKVSSEEVFDESKTYYKQVPERLLYTDSNGNLAIKANIYANDGYFKGVIEANSGTFSGMINADSGIIGGFSISSVRFTKIEDLENFMGDKYILLNQPTNTFSKVFQRNGNYYTQVSYNGSQYYIASKDTEPVTGQDYYIYENGNYQQTNVSGSFDQTKTYYKKWNLTDDDSYFVYDPEVKDDYISIASKDLKQDAIYFAQLNIDEISDYYQNLGGQLCSTMVKGNGDPMIVLDGNNGRIFAENIELGKGAILTDRLEFQENDKTTAGIYNPNKHKGTFLKAGGIELNSSGLLTLGNIRIDSTNSNGSFICVTETDANGKENIGRWIIKDDGTAEFSNIIVDKATIKDTVFETQTIQTVGSLMMFKEGFKGIVVPNQKTALFEEKTSFVKGDWAWDGKNYYQVEGIVHYPYYEKIKKSDEVFDFKECVDGYDETKTYYHPTFEQTNTYIEGITYRKLEEGFYEKLTQEPQTDTVLYIVSSNPDDYRESTDKCFYSPVTFTTPYYSANSFVETKDTDRQPGVEYYVYNETSLKYELYTEDQLVSDKVYYVIKNQEEVSNFSRLGRAENDFVISILGESRESTTSIKDFAVPNSLTLAGFNFNSDGQVTYTKNLILGDLNNTGLTDLKDAKGFGLYADNVFLNGSLTTKNNEGKSSGINTLNKHTFNKNGDLDTSMIVFWGGADGLDNVQDAPFQVSQAGTLYAQKAILKDSMVVGGNIYAANLYSASIRGYDPSNGERAALNIYDGTYGIVFRKSDSDSNKIFQINTEGFNFQSNPGKSSSLFIDLRDQYNNTAIFNGEFRGKTADRFVVTKDTEKLSNTDYYIYQNGSFVPYTGDTLDPQTTYYKVDKNIAVLKGDWLSFQVNGAEKGCLWGLKDSSNNNIFGLHLYIPKDSNSSIPTGVSVYENKISLKQKTFLEKGLSFQEDMEYKQSSDGTGYDLFVYVS